LAKSAVNKVKQPGVSAPRGRSWPVYAIVVALLAWYFATAVSAVATKSATFDETFHLTAGYCSWKFGDFRMQPENGNLPQRWAAIPLLFTDTRFPDLNQDVWRRSNVHEIGEQFFFSVGNDADAMLLRSRMMIALFGVALGAVVFFYTRSLLGVGPALISLGLYAFCPTVLTNGALVTSDMAVALFLFASMICIWRVLHQVNWRTLLVGSLVMGALFVSKFSAFLILPMGIALVAIQLISRQATVVSFGGRSREYSKRWQRALVHLATIAVHAMVVWAVIWAFYNFRFDMFAEKKMQATAAGKMIPVERPFKLWDELTASKGFVERSIVWMRDAHLLPGAYLYGFAATWQYSKERRAFFNGQYSYEGWPQFFPYCLMVKTPLTLFILLVFAAAWLVRSWRKAGGNWSARRTAVLGSLYRTASLWVLFIVYWRYAIASHLNIGHRHLLPTYPVMLVFAGGAWFWLARRTEQPRKTRRADGSNESNGWRWTRWLKARQWPALSCIVMLCLGLFAAESLARWPNYLAYFNQLVGGPPNAYRHLVDSSLDWGQDLPELKQWLDQQALDGTSTGRVYLSYFGSSNPKYYGIEATIMPGFLDRLPPRIPEPLEAGTYCLSATMLQNLYSLYPGRWNRPYENVYQIMKQDVQMFVASSPDDRRELIATRGTKFWQQLFGQFEHIRLARLTSYLRQRKPNREINYSILVYRLDAADLFSALEGPPAELDATSFAAVRMNEVPAADGQKAAK
jgi:Dolichyl-phosphate-mannose-protein mannosyltransferase